MQGVVGCVVFIASHTYALFFTAAKKYYFVIMKHRKWTGIVGLLLVVVTAVTLFYDLDTPINKCVLAGGVGGWNSGGFIGDKE